MLAKTDLGQLFTCHRPVSEAVTSALLLNIRLETANAFAPGAADQSNRSRPLDSLREKFRSAD